MYARKLPVVSEAIPEVDVVLYGLEDYEDSSERF